MKKLFLMMSLVATALVSCTEKNEPQQETDNIAEQIIGKWITAEFNGITLTCNEKIVYTFESTTNGYLSASLSDYSNNNPKWTNHTPSTVTVDGKVITMVGNLDKTTSFEAKLEIKSISNTEMLTESQYTVYHNGEIQSVNSGEMLWTKLTKDYSSAILGTWEGKVTNGEGSEYDDGEPHRWEYLDYGEYIYYQLDADSNWTANVNEMAMYFVDGTLLCTRWKNTGENEVEHREWWEIASIENGVMNWTALRRRDDGSTYTATFSMTKLEQ